MQQKFSPQSVNRQGFFEDSFVVLKHQSSQTLLACNVPSRSGATGNGNLTIEI